jgi:hypothetical protein
MLNDLMKIIINFILLFFCRLVLADGYYYSIPPNPPSYIYALPPAYLAPPAYYAPPPIYYAPPPVYFAPPPIIRGVPPTFVPFDTGRAVPLPPKVDLSPPK